MAARVFTPLARLLLRLGVGPDLVTVAGTVIVVAVSLVLLPAGHFVAGSVLITVFALADSVDGLMARELERAGIARSKEFGAFLDSTLDRFADAAIFLGLAWWYLAGGPDRVGLAAALACLVLGSVVPYARARAEGLGMHAAVGIAERADRLVIVLIGILVVGLGAPAWVLTVVLWLLAAASAVTVLQRMLTVHRQAHVRSASGLGDEGPSAAAGLRYRLPPRRFLLGESSGRAGTSRRRRRFRVMVPGGSSARRPR